MYKQLLITVLLILIGFGCASKMKTDQIGYVSPAGDVLVSFRGAKPSDIRTYETSLDSESGGYYYVGHARGRKETLADEDASDDILSEFHTSCSYVLRNMFSRRQADDDAIGRVSSMFSEYIARNLYPVRDCMLEWADKRGERTFECYKVYRVSEVDLADIMKNSLKSEGLDTDVESVVDKLQEDMIHRQESTIQNLRIR